MSYLRAVKQSAERSEASLRPRRSPQPIRVGRAPSLRSGCFKKERLAQVVAIGVVVEGAGQRQVLTAKFVGQRLEGIGIADAAVGSAIQSDVARRSQHFHACNAAVLSDHK